MQDIKLLMNGEKTKLKKEGEGEGEEEEESKGKAKGKMQKEETHVLLPLQVLVRQRKMFLPSLSTLVSCVVSFSPFLFFFLFFILILFLRLRLCASLIPFWASEYLTGMGGNS